MLSFEEILGLTEVSTIAAVGGNSESGELLTVGCGSDLPTLTVVGDSVLGDLLS